MNRNQTLLTAIWPVDSTKISAKISAKTMTRNVILAVLGSLALWASAKVQVPFYPVPMTLQTLVVLGLGAVMGWRLAGATVMLYLAQGAAGLPVFAGTPEKGLGLVYMAGPSGGYLVGFIFAAMLVGYLAQSGASKNVFKMFAAMVLGTAVIYLLGVGWLANLIGLEKAITFGLLPFLYGDLLKAALAAGIFPAIWSLVGKRKA